MNLRILKGLFYSFHEIEGSILYSASIWRQSSTGVRTKTSQPDFLGSSLSFSTYQLHDLGKIPFTFQNCEASRICKEHNNMPYIVGSQ